MWNSPMRSKGSQPHIQLPKLGLQYEEEKSLQLLRSCENQQILWLIRGQLESKVFFLKGHVWTLLTDRVTLSSSAGVAAQKEPGTYRDEIKWFQGEGWRSSSLSDRSAGRKQCSSTELLNSQRADTGRPTNTHQPG